ncbi:MAG: hypothetical protein MJA29_00600 [Candidatus Omnitrophica bacterium]|nr:hypothetical protein [Candidatus Omnitrophota bacterium]
MLRKNILLSDVLDDLIMALNLSFQKWKYIKLRIVYGEDARNIGFKKYISGSEILNELIQMNIDYIFQGAYVSLNFKYYS